MAIHLSAPRPSELKPRIVVFGVGGAGGNAVNNMMEAGLKGVEFVVANTDAQSLQYAKTESRIQLGAGITQGLGAGAHPEVGMTAADESLPEISAVLDGAHMVFITAGMGGGTGTGAAPVIARIAREMGILTVGVVTKPFGFEGRHRMKLADEGITELQKFVDTMIVIPNQNLFRIANERTTFAEAFGMADQVLHAGVRSITDLMVLPGLINLDFADVRAVMSDMGKAMMGTGEGQGDNRAMHAAQNAIQNPLLDETSLKGAKAVLVNVTGGLDMTLHEVDEAAKAIADEVDPDANIIFGAAFDPELDGRLRVSIVATGMQGLMGGLQTPQSSMAARAHPQSNLNQAPVSIPQATMAPSAFSVPEQASLSQSMPPVVAPVVTRAPVYNQEPPRPTYRPDQRAGTETRAPAMTTRPVQAAVLHSPVIQQPAMTPAETAYQQPPQAAEPKEAAWRGLFPQPRRQLAPQPQTTMQAPELHNNAQAVPAAAAPQAATMTPPTPDADSDDDLAIPSFLRRLAN